VAQRCRCPVNYKPPPMRAAGRGCTAGESPRVGPPRGPCGLGLAHHAGASGAVGHFVVRGLWTAKIRLLFRQK
jgi:hypothetical protein